MLLSSDFASLHDVAKSNREKYKSGSPFPHIVFDNVFDAAYLDGVLEEFPDLSVADETYRFSGPSERKLAGKGEGNFGPKTRDLMRFMNSEPFLLFLQELTGIEESLLPDPYFSGGGQHEIKRDGFLKLHADFNKHPDLDLDRRINVLIYLNKSWKEEYGGHLQLWDAEVKSCVQAIAPLFNRMVIFSTTDFSWHGHPDPLTCPQERSRKSLALYYFSIGRPAEELTGSHRTMFRGRQEGESRIWKVKQKAMSVAMDCIPPILLKSFRALRDR